MRWKNLPDGANARLWVSGETLEGRKVNKLAILPAGPAASADERFRHMGLEVLIEGDNLVIDMVDLQQ